MELASLVRSLLAYDALSARQWVADAAREGAVWDRIPRPEGLDRTALALAAGVVELLAARAGQSAPAWAAEAPSAPGTMFLVRAATRMPRLRRLCEEEGPEPLRRRGFLAPPEFLTVA